MKKNKLLLIMCLFLFVFGFSYLPVRAFDTNTLTTEIKVNSDEIKKGDKIEVLFSFKTDANTNVGINAFKATLDYDENVFEDIKQSDFQVLNSWQEFLYNPDNKKFVAINKSGKIDNEEFIKITLKAKKNILPTNTSIKIKDLVVSDGNKDIKIEETQGSLEVQLQVLNPQDLESGENVETGEKEDTGEAGTPSVNNGTTGITEAPGTIGTTGTTEQAESLDSTNSIGDSEINESKQNSSINNEGSHSNNKVDTTENNESYKKKSMSPLTLAILILIEIAILIAIIIIAKKKLEKEDKKISKKNKVLFIGIVTIIILAQMIGIAKAIGRKGELNGDGEINYKDLSLLQQHLIELNRLPNNLLENADINSDGKITVTDLALLVQKIENSLVYKVEIQSNMENYYPKKNEEIELRFLANTTFGATVEEVTINGENYKVEKNSDENYYFVKLNVGDISGIKEYKFTKVKLNVGKEVKVDFTEKIEVLKEEPIIENYRITELTTDAKMQVNFDLKDIDNSIQSAKVEVVEKESSEVVYEEAVQVGTNEIVADLEEGKEYLVNIYVDYNLDTNELVDHEKDNTGSMLKSYELRLNIDYKFEFNNLKAFNDKGEETTVFNKNQLITINFNSKNETMFNIETIKVNDVNYTVTKNEDTYSAIVNGITSTGEHDIKVQEVVLENGKVFELQENNVLKVHINKEIPKVEEVAIKELDGRIALDVAFKISDLDNSIIKKKLVIKNDKNEIISKTEFQDLEYKGISELGDILSSNFTVEVWVDYDLSVDNTNPLEEQVIYSNTIDAKPKVRILESSLSPEKVEKGNKVSITYKLESNQNVEVKTLLINNIKAIATKRADNTYEATINVGDKSGVTEIKLSKVIFDNNAEVLVNKVDSIEILKSVPTVNNYSIEEDFNNDKVKIDFNIEDIDNAFVSGKVELYKNDGILYKAEDINSSGKNNFELSVVENEEYTLKVTVKYKRDEKATETKEEILLEKPILLIKDYNLQVSDIKTSNTKGNTKYFNRDEEIKVSFTSTNSTKFVPAKVKINGKEYNLTKLEDNIYETIIDGFDSSGVSDITIEKIWLDNDKELDVDPNSKVQVEILKLAPKVQSFTYEQTEDEKIKVSFNIKDEESAFKKGKLVITDKDSELFSTEALSVGENEFTFQTTLSEEYKAEIFLDYDLDTNVLDPGANEYLNVKVIDDSITISKELIELKDIKSVKLYRKNGELTEQVTEVDAENFNPEDYIAQVTMKNIPTLYAEVKEGKVVDKDFVLVLNYNNAVQYEGSQKRNEIEIKFGEVDNNVATNISFAELINKVQQNPTATINLTSDLYAEDVSTSGISYLGTFRGKINGNGHTIKNLDKPLFETLDGAVIENLVIENASITGSNLGVVANTSSSSTFTNVHVKDSSISTWHSNYTGGLVGRAESGTVIDSCSVSNIYAKSYKRVGGMVGYLTNNSKIKNSYVTGTVAGRVDGIGGIIGQTAGSTTVENCYTNIKFDIEVGGNLNGTGIGGLVGWSDKYNGVVLNNNLSIAIGDNGYRITGTIYNNKSSNNYEISESELISNANENQIKSISIDDINEAFFTNTLKWDDKVWNLSGVSSNNMPTLNNLDPNTPKIDSKPQNNTVYIPEFERLSQLDGYDSNREIAYHNMHILMPYFDAKLYLDYGNKIGEDDVLNNKKIKSIIAYNQDSKMIAGLNSNNYNSIKKIKVIFEDEEVREYSVTFNKILNNIATYKIDSLDITYSYNKFVLNTNISLINEIITEVQSMNYATDIATVTPEEESRLYVDYYNESVKDKINDIVIGILQNEDEYNVYLDNEILKTKIKNDLFNDEQLQKLIYTYNYYEKWYKIDIGGIRMSDLLFFNCDSLINRDYGIKEIVKNTMSTNQTARETKNTLTFYNGVIKPQTNKELKDLLEYVMKLEGFNDADEWFVNNFNGIVSEKGVKGRENEIDYRAWTLLNKVNSRTNILLPILTAPQNDMYIISVPSQIVMGSMNRYDKYLAGDIDSIKESIETYTNRISNFYTGSAAFINNSASILNSRVHIQYDTRFNFPECESKKITKGTQEKGTTQDPVMKWVYEAADRFAIQDPVGAYANGHDVYWVANDALGGTDYTFKVFSHETAHNQDGYYFYEGYGRRKGTGAEDHADGNIAQDLGDGSFVFNIRNDFDIEDDASNNLKMDRINSKEKIHFYYREMFETHYLLDYLTAQAVLELTPEQQAKLVTQANYTDNGQSTQYTELTADEIRDMNLTDIEDLYNNRIVFRAPGTVKGTGPGSYGGDNHYNIYWYQPYNDNGRADSYSFKRVGFELLGVAGYTNGYVAYRSGMTKTDLEALRIATNNPNITWRDYKLQRFANVEDNLGNVSYFDVDKAIELYKEALIKDSAKGVSGNRAETNSVRRVLYGIVKRATNDFEDATIYQTSNVVEISTAEQLINVISQNELGNYKLIDDLDFSSIDVTGKEAYIDTRFLGLLDGNGHKITGLTKPLIKRIVYANIKNIEIEEPMYEKTETSALAKEAKNSMLEDIRINNANIKLPIVNKIEGSLINSGNIEYILAENEISSVDELLNINSDTTGSTKKMRYKLTADLDFSNVNVSTAIITGEFLGSLDGDGHTISNLKVPLFDTLKGTVSNLNVVNVKLGNINADSVGAIARTTDGATVKNIKLENINATATYRAGAVAGVSTNTIYSKISAKNVEIRTARFYGGGLIGRLNGNTQIEDVLVSGRLNIANTHNGGLIGAIQGNGNIIKRAYVDVDVTLTVASASNNGGLYGGTEKDGSISISDVLVVGDMSSNVNKITSSTINTSKNIFNNVYEYEDSTGISNLGIPELIKQATSDDLLNSLFYTDTLRWSNEIWDFSQVSNGDMPIIK